MSPPPGQSRALTEVQRTALDIGGTAKDPLAFVRYVFPWQQDGTILKATVPAVFLPKPGTPLWLTLRRDRCFVFPA